MSQHEINSSSYSNNSIKKNNDGSLSKAERDQFNDIFEEQMELNKLIEDELHKSESEKESSELASESDKSKKEDQTQHGLEMQHSYNNIEIQHREKLKQQNLLSKDITGKNKKASGDDV